MRRIKPRFPCPALRTLPVLIALAFAPGAAPSEAKEPAKPGGRALTMSVTEQRGPGRPLWRRWVDLDGDHRLDLVVVSGSSSTEIPSSGDLVGDLMAYLRVTPDFLDRRQVLIYRQTTSGLASWGEPLPLTGDTAAVDLADIDGDGRPEILFVAGYRVSAFSRSDGSQAYDPNPRTVLEAPVLVGHTRAFVPRAKLAASLVGTGNRDLLVPTPAGLEIRVGRAEPSYTSTPDAIVANPLRKLTFLDGVVTLDEPEPRVTDADLDGTNDLLFVRGRDLALLRGLGGGRFEGEPRRLRLPGGDRGGGGDSDNPVQDEEAGKGFNILSLAEGALSDIDGDGRLDYLCNEERDDEGSGEGKGSGDKEERTATEVQIYRSRSGLTFVDAPDTRLTIPAKEKIEGAIARPLRIDRDPRADLVVNRFSIGFFQIAKVLLTKRITIDVTFEAMMQKPDGSFTSPSGKPFQTKVSIDLKRGIESSPTAVRGDYDGDGMTDLIEFTSKPAARLHLTTPAGEFPESAALSVALPRSPEDGALVDVEDIDGDGRSDVAYFALDGSDFIVTLLRSTP